MPNGFDVSPDEIDAHAKAVDSTVSMLGHAGGAAASRLGFEDFGVIGQSFAGYCNAYMEYVTSVLKEAHTAADKHAEAVRAWAETNRVNEDSITSAFGGGG
ncbi:hypothetical protein [Actinokineospora pegani]|uniref:hypothetical protein n=1 Tax=Actinokineospora pegani TaxID=2654637 RepID=UPI0012E9DF0B|nr:hypothetical protein [Actinokineospora pegani]